MNSKKIFMMLVSVLLGTVAFSQETLWDENEMPCQEYSVGITTDAQYNESENAYLGCHGTTVSAQIMSRQSTILIFHGKCWAVMARRFFQDLAWMSCRNHLSMVHIL